MSKHVHGWRRLYEELLIGGAAPIGWECSVCAEYVGNSQLTPAGLDGEVSQTASRLVGPHGGRGNTADGGTYKEQIVHEDGKLEVIR